MSDLLEAEIPYQYTMYGLKVASCLSLPACPSDGGEPDVHIRPGEVPEALSDPQTEGVLYQTAPNHFLFHHEGVARYLVSNGTEILIESVPEADITRLRLFLLSSVFGALLHQRSLLPLHGSAIAVNGEAVVFLGISGAGKSTLAAAFLKRGYPVLSDDISVISANGNAQPVVHPGYPQIRLWADAAPKVDQAPEDLVQMLPDLEKYLLSIPDKFCQTSLPLKRIYVLSVTTAGGLDLGPLTGMGKLEALNDHTYRANFLDGMGNKAAHFKSCASVSKYIPLNWVTRPRQPFLLNELVKLLEEDFSA